MYVSGPESRDCQHPLYGSEVDVVGLEMDDDAVGMYVEIDLSEYGRVHVHVLHVVVVVDNDEDDDEIVVYDDDFHHKFLLYCRMNAVNSKGGCYNHWQRPFHGAIPLMVFY